MTKAQPLTRHIVSINDLTNKEIETIFQVATGFLKELADNHIPYRIGRGTSIASKFILATLSTSRPPAPGYRSKAPCCGSAAPISPAPIRQ